MKSYNIICKKPELLHFYGFVKVGSYTYDKSTQGTRGCLALRVEKGKLQIISASAPSIKTICEMYKDGVIEFVDFKHEPKKIYIRVSEQELEMITKHREALNDNKLELD